MNYPVSLSFLFYLFFVYWVKLSFTIGVERQVQRRVKSASVSEPTSRVRCNVCSVAFCNSSFLARFYQSLLSSLVYWNLFFLHSFVEVYSFFTNFLQSVLSLPVFVVYSFFIHLLKFIVLLIFAVYFSIHILKFVLSFTRLSISILLFYCLSIFFYLFVVVYHFFYLFIRVALSFTCLSGSTLSSPVFCSLLFLYPFFESYSFFIRFLQPTLFSSVPYFLILNSVI